jgi:hypothetical protein
MAWPLPGAGRDLIERVLAAFELCAGLGDVVLARLLGEGAWLRLDARHGSSPSAGVDLAPTESPGKVLTLLRRVDPAIPVSEPDTQSSTVCAILSSRKRLNQVASSIHTVPHAHGDHFHFGPAVVSTRDATGLGNPSILNTLARTPCKGLLLVGRAGLPVLTAEGLAYDTGIAAEILHSADN